jgi:hypothetical protein
MFCADMDELDFLGVREPRNGGLSYPFHVGTSFNLSAEADDIFLFAVGSMSTGVVTLHPSDDVDEVVVKIVANYYNGDILSRSKVCAINTEEGLRGWNQVGFWVRSQISSPYGFLPNMQTPDDDPWSLNDVIDIEIDVLFPAHKAMSKFTTLMPMYRHVIEDFRDKTTFQTINLQGSNREVISHVSSRDIARKLDAHPS